MAKRPHKPIAKHLPRGSMERHQRAKPKAGSTGGGMVAMTPRTLAEVQLARELFWNNFMRELLTSLSIEAMNHRARLAASRTGAAPGGPYYAPPGADAAQSPADQPAPPPPLAPHEPAGMFDGRLAIITTRGERIPIADVFPLFACGIPGNEGERALSMAVECTVFQIRTPAGEVYTLPVHEIRGLHSLSEELLRQLAQAARAERGDPSDEPSEPFGFAAYTSLARTRIPGTPPADSAGATSPGHVLGPGI